MSFKKELEGKGLELKEQNIIRPEEVEFELVFRESEDGDENRMQFEPVGEFHYFSGENRPIAPKYKIYLPERFRNKESLRVVFEEMGRYLVGQFAGHLAPETEKEFSVCLFGGYDSRIKMATFNDFFPRLRFSLEKRGVSISVEDWEAILKEMNELKIDAGTLFSPKEVPFNEKNYKNFWQYEIFGATPPQPPGYGKEEKFSPPTIRIKIDEDLLKLARENRKNIDDLMLSGKKLKSESEIKKEKQIQLKERYQCTYGVNPAGQTIESMSYYPEISDTPSNIIEIKPKGVGYERTASAAPSVPSLGWKVIFPRDTPRDTAAIFMSVWQSWDGMSVLDQFTVGESARVEWAFRDAEGEFSPEDYKKFIEWVKGKKVKSVESGLEAAAGVNGKNLAN